MAKDIYNRKEYSIAEIAYLAGIIDGEGCIYIGNHSCNAETGDKYFQTIMKVTSTDKCLIDWLQKIFGGLVKEYTPNQTPENSRKPAWFWQASGERLTHLCELLIPYAIIKKTELEIMLRMRNTYQGVTQKGKYGIQRNSQELLNLRQFLMDQIRALHVRNYSYKKD
jgi:hypothetical protein